jgi:hypothetical protein
VDALGPAEVPAEPDAGDAADAAVGSPADAMPPPADAKPPVNDAAVGPPDGATDKPVSMGQPDAAIDKPTSGGVQIFVAVGYDPTGLSLPRVATSCDGRVWKDQTIAQPPGTWPDAELNGLRGVGFGGGRFVAVGGGTGTTMDTRRLYVSTDGVNWVHENQAAECNTAGTNCNSSNICTKCQFMGDAGWLDDGSAAGVWFAAGGNAQRLYSTDGAQTWKHLPVGSIGQYRRVASEGARAAATADSGLSLIQAAPGQTPPLTFTDQAFTQVTEPSLAFGAGTVVAAWPDTICKYFAAGTWTPCVLPHAPTTVTSIVHDGTSFWLLGRDPPYVSIDGITYTQSATTAGTDYRQVRFANGVFVAPSLKRWSANGIQWQTMTTPPTFAVVDVEVGTVGACP